MSSRLDEIQALAEDVSKASIDALLVIMNDESISDEEFEAADEAFKTVSFLYAFPETDEDERDLMICKMIAERLQQLQDLAYDFAVEEDHLIEAKFGMEVATRMFERAEDEDKKDRKIDVSVADNLVVMAEIACGTIEQEMEHLNDWMDCAHEMIASEKYKELPEECFEVLFPEEDEDEEADFEDEECDDTCEDEEDEMEEGPSTSSGQGGCCGGGGCK